MNLPTFFEEYKNLSVERRVQALDKFIAVLKRDPERYKEIIDDIFSIADTYDVDDMFGTEGLDV